MAPSDPHIASDYSHTFATLKALPCDIFLVAHGAYFDMQALVQLKADPNAQVWIDPHGYQQALAERSEEFEAELKRQQK